MSSFGHNQNRGGENGFSSSWAANATMILFGTETISQIKYKVQ